MGGGEDGGVLFDRCRPDVVGITRDDLQYSRVRHESRNRVALMATRQVPGPPGGLIGAGRVRGGLTAMQELAGSTRRICFGSGTPPRRVCLSAKP